MFKMAFDVDKLTSRINEMSDVMRNNVRPAAQAGAQVFYDEMKIRALTIGKSRQLQASIYQKFVVESREDALGLSATYLISWRKQKAKTNIKGQPNPNAGLPYTTMGYWIEYGYVHRYMAVQARSGLYAGQWVTLVRPEMRGKPKPKWNDTRAVKDAYWMPRPGGPLPVAPKPFLRSTYEAKQNAALDAASIEMNNALMRVYL
jgi:hypothetical protein